MPPELTPEIVRAAIAGFEQQSLQISAQIRELRAMLSSGNTATNLPGSTAPKRRRFSAESRRRMAFAQRARWVRIRGEAEPSRPASAEAPKAKRRLSAAGRKSIQEALRRRWALKRAEAARAQTAGPRESAQSTKKGAAKTAAKRTAPAMAAKRTP